MNEVRRVDMRDSMCAYLHLKLSQKREKLGSSTQLLRTISETFCICPAWPGYSFVTMLLWMDWTVCVSTASLTAAQGCMTCYRMTTQR